MKNLLIKEFGHDEFTTHFNSLLDNFDSIYKALSFKKDLSLTENLINLFIERVNQNGLNIDFEQVRVLGKKTLVDSYVEILVLSMSEVANKENLNIADLITQNEFSKLSLNAETKSLTVLSKANQSHTFTYQPSQFNALSEVIIKFFRFVKKTFKKVLGHVVSGQQTLESFVKSHFVENNLDLFTHKLVELFDTGHKFSDFIHSIEKPAAVKSAPDTVAPVDVQDNKADGQEKAPDKLNALHLDLIEQELRAKAEFLQKFEEYLELKSKRLKVLNKVIDDGK